MFKFKPFRESNTIFTMIGNDTVIIDEIGKSPKVAGLLVYNRMGQLVFYKKGMKHSLHYFRKYKAYAASKGVIDQLPDNALIALEVTDNDVTKYYKLLAKDWRRLSIVDDFGHGTQYFLPIVHLKPATKK